MPSSADKEAYVRFEEAGKLLGIEVLDQLHVSMDGQRGIHADVSFARAPMKKPACAKIRPRSFFMRMRFPVLKDST